MKKLFKALLKNLATILITITVAISINSIILLSMKIIITIQVNNNFASAVMNTAEVSSKLDIENSSLSSKQYNNVTEKIREIETLFNQA